METLSAPFGMGKTTFLKTLLGQLDPLGGQLKQGANLRLSYFSQTQEKFNPRNTVIDEFLVYQHAIPGQEKMLPNQARDYLARYLFQGEFATDR